MYLSSLFCFLLEGKSSAFNRFSYIANAAKLYNTEFSKSQFLNEFKSKYIYYDWVLSYGYLHTETFGSENFAIFLCMFFVSIGCQSR